MNGKKARKIRKLVYGESGAPRHREYTKHKVSGKITAGPQRELYQRLKKSKSTKNLH